MKRPAAKSVPVAKKAGYSSRPRLDKMGIKPGMRVAVIGLDDRAFLAELSRRTADVTTTRPRAGTDVIVFHADTPARLSRLAALQTCLKRDGAIWAVWPKGRREIGEGMIREAALAQGLVDVKVMAFSETLSGLRLVIPVAKR